MVLVHRPQPSERPPPLPLVLPSRHLGLLYPQLHLPSLPQLRHLQISRQSRMSLGIRALGLVRRSATLPPLLEPLPPFLVRLPRRLGRRVRWVSHLQCETLPGRAPPFHPLVHLHLRRSCRISGIRGRLRLSLCHPLLILLFQRRHPHPPRGSLRHHLPISLLRKVRHLDFPGI